MNSEGLLLESSVIAIVGRRGHGKSALLSEVGVIDKEQGKKVISNYELSLADEILTFEEIIELPDVLENCTLLLDEFQVGAGARSALKKSNQTINKFITQLRKRNIILYFTTQNFKFMDIDVRSQTDYIITTEKVDFKDESDSNFIITVIDRHDVTDSSFGSVINILDWDASELFEKNVYDTNEIISFGKE